MDKPSFPEFLKSIEVESFWSICQLSGNYNEIPKHFELYDYQKDLVNAYENEDFIILKKFRQGGFTTLSVVYSLYLCYLGEKDESIFLAFNMDREACCVGNLIDRLMQGIPEGIMPNLVKQTDHEKVFDNGCSILLLSSQSGSLRGRSFSRIFIDESAFHRDMDNFWKAIYPCISEGGKVVVQSTPSVHDGGSWFKKTYLDAMKLKNKFRIFHTSYKENPQYTPEFIETLRSNLGDKGFKLEIEAEFI